MLSQEVVRLEVVIKLGRKGGGLNGWIGTSERRLPVQSNGAASGAADLKYPSMP